MKKIFYSLIVSVLLFSCTTKPKFKIQGELNGVDNGSAVLSKVVDNKLVTVDSVAIKNGNFVFTGAVEQPEFYLITFSDTLDRIQLFVENFYLYNIF